MQTIPANRISRRTFLRAAAATGAAAGLVAKFPLTVEGEEAAHAVPYPENGTLIPDSGWRLLIDDKAQWQDDNIFLPEDVMWKGDTLCGKGKPLPVNAPTGGWSALTPEGGRNVLLPTSVEQHFWGRFGSGPYTPEEYRYAAPAKDAAPPADDNVPQNGAYLGVSWWYRAIEIPASMTGKRVFLHVRGAHLRAEIYLNGKLCGYSIMEELPFEADLTHAANAGGENLLAIRITNPFGRYDWVDGLNAKWGQVSLYRSHGFGALDRGITMSAHQGNRIVSAWVLNTPDPGKVTVHFEVETKDKGYQAQIREISIIDSSTGKVVQADHSPQITFGGDREEMAAPEPSPVRDGYWILRSKAEVICKDAEVWDLDHPKLYHLRIELTDMANDIYTVAFGFRWFAPEGIGANALFRLNGRRIRIYSSISWGFWGLNGMFPVPELAEKEVTAAKTLGLNCLNFHRNLAKEDVLRKHDELGLLRYMEPGAGKMAIGRVPPKTAPNANSVVPQDAKTEAEKFAQSYMFVKCVEMVKAHRSHPSVIEYCLQNELGADLKNPATLAVLKAMHDQDASRCVVLNDGFVARGAAQAWYEPYNDKLHRSDETNAGDWWNNHQGAGDQWYDEFYKSPTQYTYRAPYKDILTEYGEMEGCARPEIHGLMVHQITETYKKYGGDSYDLTDHREILAGYDEFLTKWGFRKAFPAADSVLLAVGKTCYESWMNYMENVRISDELDFAVISGWESTAIENHSGIVDNLRNFKSDPKLIAGSLLPVRPIAKQRSLTVALGTHAIFDLYLANDTSQPAIGTLTFTMITPSGKLQDLIKLPCPAYANDRFSYLLKEAFETPALDEEGFYRFKFAISSAPLNTQTKEIWVAQVDAPVTKGRRLTIGVSGITSVLRRQLGTLSGVDVRDFKSGEKVDMIVAAGLTSYVAGDQNIGETTGESMPVMKPGHTPEPGEVPVSIQLGRLSKDVLESVEQGTPLLAIPQTDTLSDGVAKQLAEAGAFRYHGPVGNFRAPWMGNWYFVRDHPLFAGMPVNQAMGGFYQAKGRQSNGLIVDGQNVEIVVGYSRDHDRKVGAGTFTTKLGSGKVVFHRVPELHPVLQQRLLGNMVKWLANSR
jgi:beta-galactosidase